jgi:hypothetical protein
VWDQGARGARRRGVGPVHEIGGDRDELGGGSAIGQLGSDVLYETCISARVDTDADRPRTWGWDGGISAHWRIPASDRSQLLRPHRPPVRESASRSVCSFQKHQLKSPSHTFTSQLTHPWVGGGYGPPPPILRTCHTSGTTCCSACIQYRESTKSFALPLVDDEGATAVPADPVKLQNRTVSTM